MSKPASFSRIFLAKLQKIKKFFQNRYPINSFILQISHYFLQRYEIASYSYGQREVVGREGGAGREGWKKRSKNTKGK